MPPPSPKLAATAARAMPTGRVVETCERPSAVISARPPANAKKNPAANKQVGRRRFSTQGGDWRARWGTTRSLTGTALPQPG